ncbi:hypothetical protein F2Q70_00025655 [Brassica cretica]|uniref:Uncharacterized protein n=1 Tax=Brassica cretica TaxID=69181 RepID=A0A8S9L6J3_BRACR|nr:hypothetical protein F2Q70_00025655 [Brassica cretica]
MLLKFSSDVLLTTSRNEGTKKLLDSLSSLLFLSSSTLTGDRLVLARWRNMCGHRWIRLLRHRRRYSDVYRLQITLRSIKSDKAVLSSSGFQADVKALQKVLNSRHLVYQHQHNKQMSHQDLQEH